MDDLLRFISMGGYGLYVWSAYMAAGIAFLGLWLSAFYTKQAVLQQLIHAAKENTSHET